MASRKNQRLTQAKLSYMDFIYESSSNNSSPSLSTGEDLIFPENHYLPHAAVNNPVVHQDIDTNSTQSLEVNQADSIDATENFSSEVHIQRNLIIFAFVALIFYT